MGQQFSTVNSMEMSQKLQFGKDNRLHYIKQKFLFSPAQFMALEAVFKKIDKSSKGYIRVEDMFTFLREELTSIIAPYLIYMFSLIEKEMDNSVNFFEWLPAVSVYCLYSKDQIVNYVFQMLDQDHDHYISKKDIMKFLVSERYESKTFPFSYVKAVELMEVERPDKITLDIFIKIQQDVPFLCFPAFRLQENLREKILGESFWMTIKDLIKAQENLQNKNKQVERLKEENFKKEQLKIDKKIAHFNQIVDEIPSHGNLFKKVQQIRQTDRSMSDTRIETKFILPEDYIDDFYQHQIHQMQGTLWQPQQVKQQFKEMMQLHWGSKSEKYIKIPLKETDKKVQVPVRIGMMGQRIDESPKRSVFKLHNSRQNVYTVKQETDPSFDNVEGH